MSVDDSGLFETTNASLLTLYNLEAEFSDLMRQYNQAYLNYIAMLNNARPTGNKYVYSLQNLNDNVRTSCTGTQTSITQPSTYQTADSCEALCSAAQNCGGYDLSNVDSSGKHLCKLYSNSNSNPISAVQGTDTNYGCYKQVLTPTTSLSDTITYLDTLNNKLTNVNLRIQSLLNYMQTNDADFTSENRAKLTSLKSTYSQLLAEKENIKTMEKQFQTTKEEDNSKHSIFNNKYANYIFWILLGLFIFIFTCRYMIFPGMPFNNGKFIFWYIYFSFLIISIMFSSMQSGFLIMCILIAYLFLYWCNILPGPP